MLTTKLSKLKDTETRIILLYATNEEASKILQAATEMNLTEKDFVWICTQSIVGDIGDQKRIVPHTFQPGMLGKIFKLNFLTDTTHNSC